jgi:hypothetical protein
MSRTIRVNKSQFSKSRDNKLIVIKLPSSELIKCTIFQNAFLWRQGEDETGVRVHGSLETLKSINNIVLERFLWSLRLTNTWDVEAELLCKFINTGFIGLDGKDIHSTEIIDLLMTFYKITKGSLQVAAVKSIPLILNCEVQDE